MNRENSQEDSGFKHGEAEEQKTADDLKFIRSVIEKTCRKIDPGWPIMITWGLIIMIGFPVLYFLKIRQLDNWLSSVFLFLSTLSLKQLCARERLV